MHSERGDIISGWLIRLAIFMAVLGLLGYEALSMTATAISLDGHADRVADAAADVMSHRGQADPDEAEAAAYEEAAERDVEITSFEITDSVVIVTVTKTAPTVFVHKIPGLRELTEPSATRQSKWGP